MKEDKDNFLDAVNKAKQRLAAGERPENVFDWCGDFHEGFAVVGLDDKYNYIDHDGNYLSDKWFDWCGDFHDGFAPSLWGMMCYIKDKYNLHITTKPYVNEDGISFLYEIYSLDKYTFSLVKSKTGFNKSEDATNEAIKFIFENLI